MSYFLVADLSDEARSHVATCIETVLKPVVPHAKWQRPERVEMPVQAAVSPLIGLIMATSGCPVLGRLRPQTRFHLPFASELEAIARASSLYLLEQYFVAQKGGTPNWQLEGLASTYRAIGVVNRAFANRLRAAATKDANVNALIRLSTISHAVPDTIENQMEDLRFFLRRVSGLQGKRIRAPALIRKAVGSLRYVESRCWPPI